MAVKVSGTTKSMKAQCGESTWKAHSYSFESIMKAQLHSFVSFLGSHTWQCSGMAGIEPRSIMCKESILPMVLSRQIGNIILVVKSLHQGLSNSRNNPHMVPWIASEFCQVRSQSKNQIRTILPRADTKESTCTVHGQRSTQLNKHWLIWHSSPSKTDCKTVTMITRLSCLYKVGVYCLCSQWQIKQVYRHD